MPQQRVQKSGVKAGNATSYSGVGLVSTYRVISLPEVDLTTTQRASAGHSAGPASREAAQLGKDASVVSERKSHNSSLESFQCGRVERWRLSQLSAIRAGLALNTTCAAGAEQTTAQQRHRRHGSGCP